MLQTCRLLLLAGILTGITATGCKKEIAVTQLAEEVADAVSDKPTAEENQRIAAEAMTVKEVVAKLQDDATDAEILEEVRRRRLTTTIVDAHELELAANGASQRLIKQLKDPANLLTEEQEAIYMQLRTQRTSVTRLR